MNGSQTDLRLGILGGTFDPPHVGHLILAMEAFYQLSLDKVLWVIAPNPPHKIGKKITPIDIRIKMVKKAINEDPMFRISRVDIDRPGPHYILDSMKILHKKHSKAELVFILGGDSLQDLPSWHEPCRRKVRCYSNRVKAGQARSAATRSLPPRDRISTSESIFNQ